MKKIIQKLTDKLCECEAVKEDINKEKIGGQVYDCEDGEFLTYVGGDNYYSTDNEQIFEGYDAFEYIGNPLELRHLMMYCEEKGYNGAIGTNGKFIGNRNEAGSYTEFQLDNTLPFHEQPEQTLKLILDFLNR